MATTSVRQPARILLLLLCLLPLAHPASAQQTGSAPLAAQAVAVSPLVYSASTPALAATRVAGELPVGSRTASPVLTSLQVSFGALQVLDVASTLRAFDRGHTEGNPLMRGVAGSPLALAAVKAGAAVSTLVLTNRVAKKNRVAAIAIMAAVNSAYAVIVARNLRAGR